MKKIVVIGASAASIGFISKLRSFDTSSTVICFSGENCIPYNRCLLADVVSQDKNFDDITLKSETFFADNNIDLRLNSWVTEIDKDSKFVVCNGQQESYEYLFIGTGTQPYIPAIAGVNIPGVFGFHMLADIDRLDDYIASHTPKSAVVVGAGINGIEAASALLAKGLKVAVVDNYDFIMSQQVDQKVAQFIENKMRQIGITLYKGQKVTAISTRNKDCVGKIEFSSGAFLPTDCVILATGNRVNSDLVMKAGLVMHNELLLVNDKMQTSDPFIFAGGDICVTADIISKELVRSATWSDAMLAGLTAATQLSDKPRTFPGVVGMRDSEFFGLEFYACGQTVDVDVFDVINIGNKNYRHTFYLFDNQLKGFVLVGKVEELAKYRTWYLTQELVDASDFDTSNEIVEVLDQDNEYVDEYEEFVE